MKHTYLVIGAALSMVAGSLGVAQSVQAQSCAGDADNWCTREATHIDTPFAPYQGKYVEVGGIDFLGVPVMAICILDNNGNSDVELVWDQDGRAIKLTSQYQLRQHVSMCGTSGSDNFSHLSYASSGRDCEGIAFHTLQLNGYRLTMSGLDGNDLFQRGPNATASQRVCGGRGNDVFNNFSGGLNGALVRLYGGPSKDTVWSVNSSGLSWAYGQGNDDWLAANYCSGGSGSDDCTCSWESSCDD